LSTIVAARRDPGQDDAERALEIADLARRVLAGVALTLPVLYAAMAHDVFGPGCPVCC